MNHHLSASVAQPITPRETSVHLRRPAAVLRSEALGTGADGAILGKPSEPAPDCHLCAEAINPVDPVVTQDNGEAIHVRCWRLPDTVHAPLLTFAESPMPPLEAFRSRPGRPPRDRSYDPMPKLSGARAIGIAPPADVLAPPRTA
jgi:hypothetical protein